MGNSLSVWSPLGTAASWRSRTEQSIMRKRKRQPKPKGQSLHFSSVSQLSWHPPRYTLVCSDNDSQQNPLTLIVDKFYQFRRTKIVTISPLFVFINMMDKELWYTQSGVKDLSYSLLPNARIPFHWPDGGRKAAREISIRLGSLWAWYPQLALSTCFFFRWLPM